METEIIPQTLAEVRRTKAEWEAEQTGAALRKYIFAQGDHQAWLRDQEKLKAEVKQ